MLWIITLTPITQKEECILDKYIKTNVRMRKKKLPATFNVIWWLEKKDNTDEWVCCVALYKTVTHFSHLWLDHASISCRWGKKRGYDHVGGPDVEPLEAAAWLESGKPQQSSQYHYDVIVGKPKKKTDLHRIDVKNLLAALQWKPQPTNSFEYQGV